MGYLASSTLHPDLRDPAQRRALAEHWRDGGGLRLSPVLEPGLAAELAVVCGDVPLAPRQVPEHQDVSWSSDVHLPEVLDVQHGEAIIRLVRFLRVDMPELVADITGRTFSKDGINAFHLWSLRKGSYVDNGLPWAPEGGLDVRLGLTSTTWPVEWGGHMVWRSDRGKFFSLPPAIDALDIVEGGVFHIPLVTRHVRSLCVRTTLRPLVTP